MNIFRKYQDKAYSIYESVAETKRFSNSYLFIGPSSSQKDIAALYFASIILGRSNLKHPDLHILEHKGTKEYTIDQIRDVIVDIDLAPIEAKTKVYIFKDAEKFGVSSANAFLKSLEEPPINTCIILLASNEENVLPTILSRCSVVPFVEVPNKILVDELQKNINCNVNHAIFFLILSDGNLLLAKQYFDIRSYYDVFKSYFELLLDIIRISDIEFMYKFTEIFLSLIAHIDISRRMQKEQLTAQKDFHTSYSKKEQEKQNKRLIDLKFREHFCNLLTATQAFFHDYALAGTGVGTVLPNELVVFPKKFYKKNVCLDAAVVTDEVSNTCKKAKNRLECNVAIRNVLDSFVIELKKVFK